MWDHLRKDGSRFVAVLRDVSESCKALRALMDYQMQLPDLIQRLLAQERETSRQLAQTLHDRLGRSLAVARPYLDAAGGAVVALHWVGAAR